jgi:DNA-binding SARP family transcriptional activator
MRFRVLGPLQIGDGRRWSTIRAAQQRVVLAVLLADAGRVVSADRLMAELWGDDLPRTALNTVHGYVAQLRKLLGPAQALHTRGHGYVLEAGADELDARVFEDLADAGQRDLAEGRLSTGAGRLAEALALWRGPALHDVPASPSVVAEAERLEQRRLTALEARLGAELALGRHAETVDELRRLVAEHPLREQLRCRLMLAMYRCGRRAEALDVYRAGRALLVAELGVEPGPELRELERAVLADDLGPAGPVAVRVTPAQVPADVPGFTGRQAALAELDDLAAGQPVVTIAGTAGVGKTALAVRWAHHARDRFRDGRLYVDLRGYSTDPPLRPVDALARFLHALGVPAEQVPTDVDEAAALYRSLLAERRILVLLDNAHHPDQVRPLLPGAPGCLALVTSRDALTGLVARDGARSLRLGVLSAAEADALLAHLLGPGRAGEDRTELAGLCARLPLALRITAANLAASPHRTVAAHAAELRAGNRLAALQVDGDAQAAVRAAFDLSYAALPDEARGLFRLLGLVPGPDTGANGVAVLAGTTTAGAERLLATLIAAHLVEHTGSGRYRCHDLLRLYARERGEQDDTEAEREAATRRLHDWYLHTVDAAATLLYPQMRRLTPPPGTGSPAAFGDDSQALAWLDAERAGLVAVVGDCPPATAGLLADLLRGYFWLRMYAVDWLVVAGAGLAAADASGDPRVRTGALLSLADAHYKQGRYTAAVEHSTDALATARRAGWPEGEAAALNNLGNLHKELGRLPEAVGYHRRALALNRRIGRRTGQAYNLNNLGCVYRDLGDPAEALVPLTEALAISREIGTTHGEALCLTNLGGALLDLGRLDEAVDHLCRALAGFREVGDRGGGVDTANELAAAHRDRGDHATAFEHARAALAVARDTAHRGGETDVLNTLGSIHLGLGERGAAAGLHRQALALARDIAHRAGETRALVGLAAAEHDVDGARTAVAMAGAGGYRLLEARARTVLASLLAARGATGEATAQAEQALTAHRRTGHRLGEATALVLLGDLADRTGDRDRALAHHRDAAALLRRIGAVVPALA